MKEIKSPEFADFRHEEVWELACTAFERMVLWGRTEKHTASEFWAGRFHALTDALEILTDQPAESWRLLIGASRPHTIQKGPLIVVDDSIALVDWPPEDGPNAKDQIRLILHSAQEILRNMESMDEEPYNDEEDADLPPGEGFPRPHKRSRKLQEELQEKALEREIDGE